MPTKADRRAPLPAGLVPLLSQQQLETYYDVSDWTVLQWIKAGMPVEPMKNATGEKAQRRFDLARVQAWHAEQLPATA
jgi:phage terminase Nu1 subunit (DNA packaging protein)